MLTDCLDQDPQVPSMAPVARSGFDFKRVVFQRLRNEVAIAQYSFVPDPTLMLSPGMLQGFPAAITSDQSATAVINPLPSPQPWCNKFTLTAPYRR